MNPTLCAMRNVSLRQMLWGHRYCPSCNHAERKPVPLSTVNRDDSRAIRYLCACGELRKKFPVRPLDPCPVPDDLLRKQGFQSNDPDHYTPPQQRGFRVNLRWGGTALGAIPWTTTHHEVVFEKAM